MLHKSVLYGQCQLLGLIQRGLDNMFKVGLHSSIHVKWKSKVNLVSSVLI